MRDKIKLESTAGTGHFYTTTKNKRKQTGRVEYKKFCPFCQNRTTHRESR